VYDNTLDIAQAFAFTISLTSIGNQTRCLAFAAVCLQHASKDAYLIDLPLVSQVYAPLF